MGFACMTATQGQPSAHIDADPQPATRPNPSIHQSVIISPSPTPPAGTATPLPLKVRNVVVTTMLVQVSLGMALFAPAAFKVIGKPSAQPPLTSHPPLYRVDT
jgi:hypothetical protein